MRGKCNAALSFLQPKSCKALWFFWRLNPFLSPFCLWLLWVFSDKNGSGHRDRSDWTSLWVVKWLSGQHISFVFIRLGKWLKATERVVVQVENTLLQTPHCKRWVTAVTLKVCPKKLYPSVFQNPRYILPPGVWSMPIVACLAHSMCSGTSRAPALARVDPKLWPPGGSARLGWMAGVPYVLLIVKGLLRARSFNDWPSPHFV